MNIIVVQVLASKYSIFYCTTSLTGLLFATFLNEETVMTFSHDVTNQKREILFGRT